MIDNEKENKTNKIEPRVPSPETTWIFDSNIEKIIRDGTTLASNSGDTFGSEYTTTGTIEVQLKSGYVLNTVVSSNPNYVISSIAENTFDIIDNTNAIAGEDTTLTLTSKKKGPSYKKISSSSSGSSDIIPGVWYGAGKMFDNVVYTKDGVEQYSTMIEPFAGGRETRRVKNKNLFKVKVIVASVIGEAPQIVEINPNEESDYYNSANYEPEIWAVMKVD